MKRMYLLLVLVFATSVAVSPVSAQEGKRDPSAEEKAWDSGDKARTRDREATRDRAPAESEGAMRDRAMRRERVEGDHVEGAMMREGESGPAMVMRRYARRFAEVRARAEQLRREEDEIKGLDEGRAERPEGSDGATRLKRIIELRKKLLTLEREEFASNVREETGRILTELDGRMASDEIAKDDRRRQMAEWFRADMKRLHDSATDFDTLYQALEETGPPREMMGLDVREERIRTEMEHLRMRLERLEEELGGGSGYPARPFQPGPGVFGPDAPLAPPPPPDAPPPVVEMRERQRRQGGRSEEPPADAEPRM